MEQYDLTHGWWLIDDDGDDVILEGPGDVMITMRHFDRALLERSSGLGPEFLGETVTSLRQLSWRYPLERLKDGDASDVWLELLITWHPALEGYPSVHVLHVGTTVAWHLEARVGERLHHWFSLLADRRAC